MFPMACTISNLLGNGGNGNGKLRKINALAFPFPWKPYISTNVGNVHSTSDHAFSEAAKARCELAAGYVKPLGNGAAG